MRRAWRCAAAAAALALLALPAWAEESAESVEADGVASALDALDALDALVSEEAAESVDADGVAASALVSLPRGQDSKALADGLKIVSAIRSETPEALKMEVIAAEQALSLRAEVDGAPAIYDSPAVSISLRRISPAALVESGSKLETVDGAGINIPADPRVKGRYGGPVTITVTSYHAGDKIKDLPEVKYGKTREIRRVSGADSGTRQKEDRVDFFMTKTSVTWRGTVQVKVPGLNAQVPAHDRPWTPLATSEETLYPEEKEEVRKEAEAASSLPVPERERAFRKLARRWHPDKNPEDIARANEVFTYLQELRAALSTGAGAGAA